MYSVVCPMSYRNSLLKKVKLLKIKNIKDKLESEGCYVIKLMKTNKNGIPDLLVFRDGVPTFIEVKKENGKLSRLQSYRLQELNKYGIKTKVHYG